MYGRCLLVRRQQRADELGRSFRRTSDQGLPDGLGPLASGHLDAGARGAQARRDEGEGGGVSRGDLRDEIGPAGDPVARRFVERQQADVEQRRVPRFEDRRREALRADAAVEHRVHPHRYRRAAAAASPRRAGSPPSRRRSGRGARSARGARPRVAVLGPTGEWCSRRLISRTKWPRSGVEWSPIASSAARTPHGSTTSDRLSAGRGLRTCRAGEAVSADEQGAEKGEEPSAQHTPSRKLGNTRGGARFLSV